MNEQSEHELTCLLTTQDLEYDLAISSTLERNGVEILRPSDMAPVGGTLFDSIKTLVRKADFIVMVWPRVKEEQVALAVEIGLAYGARRPTAMVVAPDLRDDNALRELPPLQFVYANPEDLEAIGFLIEQLSIASSPRVETLAPDALKMEAAPRAARPPRLVRPARPPASPDPATFDEVHRTVVELSSSIASLNAQSERSLIAIGHEVEYLVASLAELLSGESSPRDPRLAHPQRTEPAGGRLARMLTSVTALIPRLFKSDFRPETTALLDAITLASHALASEERFDLLIAALQGNAVVREGRADRDRSVDAVVWDPELGRKSNPLLIEFKASSSRSAITTVSLTRFPGQFMCRDQAASVTVARLLS